MHRELHVDQAHDAQPQGEPLGDRECFDPFAALMLLGLSWILQGERTGDGEVPRWDLSSGPPRLYGGDEGVGSRPHGR